MSTVAEAKSVTEQLSIKDRWELYRWLREKEEMGQLRLEDLRREIAIGIEQIERGEVAPWDLEKTKAEVRRRLREKEDSKGN
jgi:antitoxin ParD1/3/4